MAVDRVIGIPLGDAELVPRSWRALVMSSITAALGAVIIWSVYAGGISRGMHHAIALGPEADETSIAIALSESVYGLDLGYIGLADVYQALAKTVNRGASNPYDGVVQRNVRDERLLNEAIGAAASLGPQKVGYISDRSLITTMYNDQGFVDYIKLAFRLFGTRIESLYYTFFVIVAASALLFLVSFPNSLGAQCSLLAALFAFQLELHTPIFTQHMPTFAGLRHGSTLCLIPMWYFACLVVYKRRVSWLLLLVAVVQLSILILSIRIRGAASWVVVYLALLTVASGSYRWLTLQRAERVPKRWLGVITPWPILLVAAGVTLHSQYSKMKLHPIYFTDDVIPHHVLWHAAYVGLQYSPELYGFPVRPELLGSDSIGFIGALEYLRATHFIGDSKPGQSAYETLEDGGYFSPWNGGNPKYGLHDEIMRRVFLRIAREHPVKMLYLYMIKKPRAIWEVSTDLLRRSDRRLGWLLLIGGFGAMCLRIVLGSAADDRDSLKLVLVGIGAAAAATLPSLWAYPTSFTVTDTVLLVFATIPMALGLSAVGITRLVLALGSHVPIEPGLGANDTTWHRIVRRTNALVAGQRDAD